MKMGDSQTRESKKQAEQETHDFVSRNPDWYASPKNKEYLTSAMEDRNIDVTAENMESMWAEMKAKNIADLKPRRD
jgi:hypothetical protein